MTLLYKILTFFSFSSNNELSLSFSSEVPSSLDSSEELSSAPFFPLSLFNFAFLSLPFLFLSSFFSFPSFSLSFFLCFFFLLLLLLFSIGITSALSLKPNISFNFAISKSFWCIVSSKLCTLVSSNFFSFLNKLQLLHTILSSVSLSAFSSSFSPFNARFNFAFNKYTIFCNSSYEYLMLTLTTFLIVLTLLAKSKDDMTSSKLYEWGEHVTINDVL